MIEKEIYELKKSRYILERRIRILESMICEMYDKMIPEKKVCPICNNEIRLYLPTGDTEHIRSNAVCPVCGTAERHRFFFKYLIENYNKYFDINRKNTVLHFAPESGIWEYFTNNEQIEYYPVDYNPSKKGIIRAVDMTDIPYENESFDVIIAFCVLDCIKDEEKALSELKRVLKPTGVLFIGVGDNPNLEHTINNQLYNPELLTFTYTSFRLYGRDFPKRMENAGFDIKKINMSELCTDEEISDLYLDKRTNIYICNKT